MPVGMEICIASSVAGAAVVGTVSFAGVGETLAWLANEIDATMAVTALIAASFVVFTLAIISLRPFIGAWC